MGSDMVGYSFPFRARHAEQTSSENPPSLSQEPFDRCGHTLDTRTRLSCISRTPAEPYRTFYAY